MLNYLLEKFRVILVNLGGLLFGWEPALLLMQFKVMHPSNIPPKFSLFAKSLEEGEDGNLFHEGSD